MEKQEYLYTDFGKDEEKDMALLKRLDETGILWRAGEKPSEGRCGDCLHCPGTPAIILGYRGNSLSCGIKSLIGIVEHKEVSADEFVEAARIMARGK